MSGSLWDPSSRLKGSIALYSSLEIHMGVIHVGRRKWDSLLLIFFADHQPPTKIHMESGGRANGANTSTTTQRLYPHCRECSRLQGSLLTRSNISRAGQAAIRSHPFSLRVYHLFLPIPFVIAYLKSGGSQLKEKPLLSPSRFAASMKETSTQTLLSPSNTPETRSSAVNFQCLAMNV